MVWGITQLKIAVPGCIKRIDYLCVVVALREVEGRAQRHVLQRGVRATAHEHLVFSLAVSRRLEVSSLHPEIHPLCAIETEMHTEGEEITTAQTTGFGRIAKHTACSISEAVSLLYFLFFLYKFPS